VAASPTDVRSPLPDNLESQLASAGRVFRRMSHRRRWLLATGIAILLCLTCAGCSGFFISPSISSIYITPPSSTIAVNNTVQLTATATYSDGSQNKLSGETLGWSTSAATIATITSPGGLVTGVATGTATITATAQGVAGTGTVTVTPTNVTSISITTTQGSTTPQSTATIAGAPATLQFYAYANGSSNQDLTNAVTWSSSSTSVATISSGLGTGGNGLATSVAAGTTNITATITNTTSGTLVTSNTIVLTVQ
jgi:Bacterial Ig-like domain (group 2)